MLKKILLPLLLIFSSAFAYCAAQAPVKMLGKDKGEIKIINKGGIEYVDAVRMSKTLKLQTTWFGRSGQLNLKGPAGFFCVLRDGQSNATINGESYPLQGALFMDGNVLYAPISFFSSSKVVSYTNYDVEFSGGAISIEKLYNIELAEFKDTADSANIIFKTKGNVNFNKDKRGKYFAEIFFPGAVIKREETIKPKSPFVDSIRTRQTPEGASVRIQLEDKAADWDVFKSGNNIAFSASATKAASPLSGYTAEVAETVAASAALGRPSVLEEDFEGDITTAEDITVLGDEFFAASANKPKAIPSTPKGTVVNKLVTAREYTEQNNPASAKDRKIRVLIDPGHGGKDGGAVRKGSSREKDINLDVAKNLYNLLRKEKDFDVKISRDDDTFIPLGDRAKMANDFKADIFVSIHANAAKRASANGFEVYFRSDKASDAEAAETAALENEALQYEGKSGGTVSFADLLLKSLATNENINQSSKLAGHIRSSVSKKTSSLGIKVHENSAIKQANFYVLRGVNAPAVLVEMGYLSNVSDRKKLNTKSVRQKLAESIKDGVLAYAKAEGWR